MLFWAMDLHLKRAAMFRIGGKQAGSIKVPDVWPTRHLIHLIHCHFVVLGVHACLLEYVFGWSIPVQPLLCNTKIKDVFLITLLGRSTG